MTSTATIDAAPTRSQGKTAVPAPCQRSRDMFSEYVFVRQEGGRYLYRSPQTSLEWDLSIHRANLDKYISAGLPDPNLLMSRS